MNGRIPHNEDINDEPMLARPQEITLRRFKRQRIFVFSNYYEVCLQESEFDLEINEDPNSFPQAMKIANSAK